MKKFHWSVRVLLFAGILQVISCTKSADIVSKDSLTLESSGNATLPNEFNCKMRRIYQTYAGIRVTGLFTYNHVGNPISLVFNDKIDGHPDWYFVYDKQNRLKEVRLTYNETPEYANGGRYTFGYDNNGRIVTDTSFGDEYVNPIVFVTTITYDDQGRVVKENIRNIVNPDPDFPYPVRNPTFTYDNRGNLAVAGWKSSSYDNKVSVFRAHPLFQFLMRNYSRNNAAPQAKYNSKGLPLSINPGNDGFFFGSVTDLIVYDCQ
jgi:hypothetical protein